MLTYIVANTAPPDERTMAQNARCYQRCRERTRSTPTVSRG